jgi:hypothetical protein
VESLNRLLPLLSPDAQEKLQVDPQHPQHSPCPPLMMTTLLDAGDAALGGAGRAHPRSARTPEPA